MIAREEAGEWDMKSFEWFYYGECGSVRGV